MILGPTSWGEPRIEWGAPLDVAAPPAVPPGATLLATWRATEFDPTNTDCFSLDDQIWIWQPEVGVARFSLHTPLLHAAPWPGADITWFRQVVSRSWLPAVYPLWGRQVLHASATFCAVSGDAVAFTGPTHSGKSTTAYGLSRRPGWQRLSDDTLAFSVGTADPAYDAQPGPPVVRLHPLPQEVRLRPESAGYFGVANGLEETLHWPDLTPTLKAIVVLECDELLDRAASFTPLSAADALPILLRQAYALSFGIPKYNQALMRDYLTLATAVPAYRLRYRRSFDVAEDLFRSIEDHLAMAGVSCMPVASPADRG